MLDRPEQMEELMQLGTSARLLLQPLSQDDTLALARERLGVQELGSSVATVIVETSEGIPLFVEELALSLRETGAISLADGTAELILPPEELGVPHSLSSVLLSRIDRLQPELALTLKVASVIGRSFDSAALATVHPAHPGAAELARELERLKELDLIVESSPGSYDFKHALTRDTAYDLLVFDQRRQIHRAVANHLESRPDQPAETLYPFLAYHWDRAEDFSKAQTYFEKTGASALRRGANQEAIAAHSRSLDLVSRHPEEFRGIDQIRQSQWHVEIGQAHEALGNFDEALSEFYRALELVGVHLSTRPMARFGRLITESLTQLTHIILPGAIRTPEDESERTRLAQAARISSLIGEIYYFTGNLAGFPLLNLVAINLGERSGEPLVAGLAYASLGYLVGTLRLRRLADRYFRRARAAEDLETRRHWLDIPFVLDPEEMGPGHLIAAGLAESVLALTFDEWERAREIVTEALERCERLGDKYSAGIALAVRGFVNYSSGEIANALDDYRQLLASARQRSNREHEGWATSFVIPVLLAGDQVESAQAMTVSAMSILNDVDPLTVPIIHATRSQVQLRLQAREEARASAELALEAMGRTPIFIYLAGFAGMLDTLLELWSASAQGSAEQRSLSRLASQALAKMRTFAWVLPFARPKYWLFRGRIEDLKGRPTRAQRHWRRGLSIAQRSRFIWDEGQLHLELARSLPENDPKRAGHVAQARASFETVGSHHDLSRISALEPEHRGPRKTA
jgi:tetratricopeptide (TPR) repeat protein